MGKDRKSVKCAGVTERLTKTIMASGSVRCATVSITKQDEKNIRLAKQLQKATNKLLEELGMEDWEVRIACKIGEKDDSVMEVDSTNAEYKKVDITVYEVRKNFEKDLLHELLHAKIGILVKAYDKALEGYKEMMDSLITIFEERVVTDLEKTISKKLF